MTLQQKTTSDTAITSEGVKVPEIQSLTLRSQGLNQSIDWWNTAMVWALVVAAIAAVAVVITTRIILARTKQLSDVQDQISNIKESDAKIEQARIATELAAAVARAKEADARIAEAQRAAAEAGQNTARLTQENLTLQADVLKLREKMADRHLTPDQQKTVGAKLRPFEGMRINFFAMGGDSEIVGIADEILRVLADPHFSHWAVTVGAGQDSSIFSSGILVQVSPDADDLTNKAASALIEAFRSERLTVLGPLAASQGAIMGNVSRDPLAKTGPCWVHMPPLRVKIHAAPAVPLGPPIRAVFPSAEIATEEPCSGAKILETPLPTSLGLLGPGTVGPREYPCGSNTLVVVGASDEDRVPVPRDGDRITL